MSTPAASLTDQLRRDVAERNRRLEEARLKSANAMNEDPDRSRRILNASHFTGLPNEVVGADLENIESSILAQDFDIEEYKRTAPAWTSFLAENPYHMAALKDDLDNMGYVERSIKQIGLGWDATWAQVEMGLMQKTRAAQGGDFTPEQQERFDKLEQLQMGHDFGAEGFVRFLVKNAKMAGPTLYSLGQGVEFGLAGAMAGGSAAAIAGQMGPQALTPEEIFTVPGAAVGGLGVGMTTGTSMAAYELESGFAYGEYRDMGVDHDTALMASRSVGVINAALETVSIGKVVKYVPWLRDAQGAIAKQLAGDVLTRPSMRRATTNALVRFGEVLGTEVVTEVMQESVTAVTGEMIRPEDAEALTYESWSNRITETALETLQGAAIMSMLGPGMSYYSDIRRAKAAENMQVVFETLADGANKSNTAKNLKGTYQQFLQRLRAQGTDGSMWIDGQRFAEYFQENGRDPEAVAASVGIDAETLQEAVELGQDLPIPVDRYAEIIAPTQAGMELAGDLKPNENAMSAKEAEIWRANNPDIVEAVESMAAEAGNTRVDAQIESIVNDVQGQLVAAGYSPRAAGHLAQIARGIAVLAQREGMDATELYERVFGGVKRMTPEAVARRDDVDIYVDPLLDRLRAQDFPSQTEMFGPSLMDFISERGGIDITDPELDAMDFELGAREAKISKARLRRWAKEGRSLADIAELAAEAGYIASRDENLLIEALRSELMGRKVYGTVEGGNAGLRDLSVRMDELAGFIDQAGLDIDSMTNQEIREALANSETFMQMEQEDLMQLTGAVLEQVRLEQREDVSPDEINRTLARIQAMLPMVDERQDFGDLTFEEARTIAETGDTAKVRKSAQTEFDNAVKRKNAMKRLLECVSA